MARTELIYRIPLKGTVSKFTQGKHSGYAVTWPMGNIPDGFSMMAQDVQALRLKIRFLNNRCPAPVLSLFDPCLNKIRPTKELPFNLNLWTISLASRKQSASFSTTLFSSLKLNMNNNLSITSFQKNFPGHGSELQIKTSVSGITINGTTIEKQNPLLSISIRISDTTDVTSDVASWSVRTKHTVGKEFPEESLWPIIIE
jgi:hypothetical protein